MLRRLLVNVRSELLSSWLRLTNHAIDSVLRPQTVQIRRSNAGADEVHQRVTTQRDGTISAQGRITPVKSNRRRVTVNLDIV